MVNDIPGQAPDVLGQAPDVLGQALSLVVFTADVWEHVCPVVRVTGPARMAGVKVIHGNEWLNNQMVVYPERIIEADLVVIQRDFPSYQKDYLEIRDISHQMGKKVVYELDDLLIELPEDHPDVARYSTNRLAILQAIVEADAVIGSTPQLCNYLRSFNSDVFLLPNYLNDNLWQLQKTHQSRGINVVIGYLGSQSHQTDLETITPVLKNLLEQYHTNEKLTLRFWGINPPESLRGFKNIEWNPVGLVSYQEFSAYFSKQHCDIFIAPLRHNLFNRCKSAIKFLEYSALGVPGVYSRIEPYENVIIDGTNGFLASSQEDWRERLIQLIKKPELRWQMGEEAQKTVIGNWLLSKNAASWRDTYLQIKNTPRKHNDKKTTIDIIHKAQQWQLDLEKQVVILSDQVKFSNQELLEKDRALHLANSFVQEMMQSTSWAMAQKIQRGRNKFAPRGSRREQLLQLGYFSYLVLRREGVKAFLRGFAKRLKAALTRKKPDPSTPNPSVPILIPINNRIEDGCKLALPAISLVLVTGSGETAATREETQTWLNRQTISRKATEMIIWDTAAKIAWGLDRPSDSWQAATWLQVISEVNGKYICMVSDDLLQQSETYLEENWIVLTTESLAFTVNVKGHSQWVTQWVNEKLQAGLLPGGADQPLLRLIVARKCLDENLSINIAPWMKEQIHYPQLVGKVLTHTTSHPDEPGTLPFEESGLGKLCHYNDKYFYAYSSSPESASKDLPWSRIAHVLHPLDSVIDCETDETSPSNLPTVIIAQPYLAIGGAETLALGIINQLKEQIRFVTLTSDPLDHALGTLADEFRKATPHVYMMPDFIEPDLSHSFIQYLIERYQPVAFYIANGANLLYDTLEKIKRKFPSIRTINQVYDDQIGWINRYDINTVTNLDAHIGLHQRICHAYIQKGARPESVHQISATLDASHLHPEEYSESRKAEIRLKLGLPVDCKTITFASRIHPQKRPMDFVELARHFMTRHFMNDFTFSFLMVGDGPELTAVKELIQQTGLTNIHLHPFYRPISDILAVSDVVVLPSSFEGMPLIVSEAQAMGVPVVVTDVGNNRELLDTTGGGVVVSQVGDINGLAEGVLRMIFNPPEPQKIRQVTIDKYSIGNGAKQYYRVFLGEPLA